MLFLFGFIAGLIVATLIVTVLFYFRKPLEVKTSVMEKQMSATGPRPKGAIYIPPDEAQEARERIIARNRAQGRDTKVSELI